jgi:hypothetical protein
LTFTKCTGRHGNKFDYYVCSGRHKKQGCTLPYLPAHRVERFVIRYYESQITIDAERIAELEPRLTEQFERLVGYRQHEVVRCQKKVDDIHVQGHRAMELGGRFSNPDFQARVNRLLRPVAEL